MGNWCRHAVDGDLPRQAPFVRTGDIDGDGVRDVLAGAWRYSTPSGLDGDWARREIVEGLDNVALVEDLDGDGDLDVFGTSGMLRSDSTELVWAENQGQGSFVLRTNVGTVPGDFLQGVALGQFDLDPHREIALSWHDRSAEVLAVSIPERPAVDSWSWTPLSDRSQNEDLSAGDIDSDGDADLLLGTRWLENPGDGSVSWTAHELGTVRSGAPDRNELLDLTGDGRLDALVGVEEGSELYLFENPAAGTGSPWSRTVIAEDVGGGYSLDAGDVDGDGQVDVVLGEHRRTPANRVLSFHREATNPGRGWTESIIDGGRDAAIDHHDGTRLVDLDGDGDLDIVSIGWTNPRLWIYENTGASTVDVLGSAAELPASTWLGANRPNPFNTSTQIPFALPEGAHVQLAVYDVRGRLVERLEDRWYPPGRHRVTWHADDHPSGLYLYRLETSDRIESARSTLLK